MARLRVLRFAVLTVTAAMFLFGTSIFASATHEVPAPVVGDAAPNFSRMAFNHNQVVLSSFRGKVVLLNFWASWCGPCLIEMPRFVAWQREYGGQGLQVIGVSMDDQEAPALRVYRKDAVNYPAVMGDAKLGELYGGILGLPVTFLIDKHGTIRFIHRGAANLNILQAELKELLRSP